MRPWFALLPVLTLMVTLAACAPGARRGAALHQAFRTAKLAEIDAAVFTAISNRATPGAVVWIERGGVGYQRAYGRRSVLPEPEPMAVDTVFDAASLTKVLATTPSIMLLIERGLLALDEPVATYLPEFNGQGRETVTIRNLLTHTSGLRPGISLRPEWNGYDAGVERALAEVPQDPVATRFRYSDVNFILLGEVVRRVSGQPLDAFAAREIYRPLGMAHTTFNPDPAMHGEIAPTTEVNGVFLRGIVHDPTARSMGGVAGHAGLFTTAADVARFSRMMLNEGALPKGKGRLFKAETVRLMTSVQTATELKAERRGLGWDIDSPYAGPRGEHFPIGSYGHTGWTGTSLWIDPFSETFVILMSNRNHPTEDGSVLGLRRRLGTLAAEAVEGFNFAGVPGALPRQPAAAPSTNAAASARTSTGSRSPVAPSTVEPAVRNGIDALAAQGFAPLRNLKIGLITNHTGTDRERNPTIDLLHAAAGVELRCLFTPEHGLRGQLDAAVPDEIDARTGLPVYSLYGQNRQPLPAQLQGLDALVFDLQDIGCRFYTYISTMGLCLEAAGKHGVRFVVLDRVNPIAGSFVEGPVSSRDVSDFVAFHPLPVRHGMTVGELARMFNAERNYGANLTVIQIEGWKRGAWFDETGLPWINTSPNMRNLKEAILYPGVGLVEFAVSVGRGTDTPFEVVGAPYVNDLEFATALNAAGLPGIRFVPVRFKPASSVFKSEECGGAYLMLTDRDACPVVDVGIVLALTLQRLYPGKFALNKVQPLLQHGPTLEAIRQGRGLGEIKALWASDQAEFMKRREKFLLY